MDVRSVLYTGFTIDEAHSKSDNTIYRKKTIYIEKRRSDLLSPRMVLGVSPHLDIVPHALRTHCALAAHRTTFWGVPEKIFRKKTS